MLLQLSAIDAYGVFPSPEARLGLAGAVLVEAHDEWQVSHRRYLSEGSMALLTATTMEVAAAQLMAASSAQAARTVSLTSTTPRDVAGSCATS
jgi:hypothetical protein